jgi:uncharacterized protein involved in exopolysaccharide biosynthesis
MDSRQRDDEVSVIAIANLLLRHRYLMLALPVAFAIGAVAFVTVRARDYQAVSRFAPHGRDAPRAGGLAGVAAQFGLALGSAADGESPHFYAELLKSRDLLTQAALAQYEFTSRMDGGDTLAGTLVTFFGGQAIDSTRRTRRTVGKLKRNIEVSVDSRAGLVTVRTRAPWPGLAEGLNRQLLTLVADFNVQRRQSRAAAERRFVEARLQEAQGDLEAAENALTRFLEQNRVYEGSPHLTFAANRLQRRVELRQEVYRTLASSFEEARIDEVRNTPLITIVEKPEGSARRVGRSRIIAGILALFLGLVVAVMIVFFREYAARSRADDPREYAEFQRLRQTAVAELSPRQLLRRKHHDG